MYNVILDLNLLYNFIGVAFKVFGKSYMAYAISSPVYQSSVEDLWSAKVSLGLV